MTTERIIRIMAGTFILLSLARIFVSPNWHIYRFCRLQFVAEWIHRLLSAREAADKNGCQAQRQWLVRKLSNLLKMNFQISL